MRECTDEQNRETSRSLSGNQLTAYKSPCYLFKIQKGRPSVTVQKKHAYFATVHFIHTCLPTFFIARCSGVMVSSSSTAYKRTKGFNTHRLGCCVKYLFNKGLLVDFRWQQKPRIVCNIYSWRKNNLQWPVNDWLFKNTKKTKLFRVVLGNFKRLSGDCPQTPP